MLYSEEHLTALYEVIFKQQLNKVLAVLGLDTVKYAYAHQ